MIRSEPSCLRNPYSADHGAQLRRQRILCVPFRVERSDGALALAAEFVIIGRILRASSSMICAVSPIALHPRRRPKYPRECLRFDASEEEIAGRRVDNLAEGLAGMTVAAGYVTSAPAYHCTRHSCRVPASLLRRSWNSNVDSLKVFLSGRKDAQRGCPAGRVSEIERGTHAALRAR